MLPHYQCMLFINYLVQFHICIADLCCHAVSLSRSLSLIDLVHFNDIEMALANDENHTLDCQYGTKC